jgi:hypothetical protein
MEWDESLFHEAARRGSQQFHTHVSFAQTLSNMVGVDFTPIKIPGKNNRDQRRSVIAANRNVSPHATASSCGR